MDTDLSSREKHFDELILKYNKEQEQIKSRLGYSLNTYDKGKKNYLFLYESSPLDEWEKWKNYSYYHYEVFNQSMKGTPCYEFKSPHKSLYEMEMLVVQGLIYFSKYFINNIRGESLKYCFVREIDSKLPEFEWQDFPIICLKGDNNGSCYGFSHSPYLSENIPHDHGFDWKLVDCKQI